MTKLLHPAAGSRALADLALLVSRVALGVVLLAHGWQKFSEWTLAGTADSFGSMGLPAPTAAAYYVTFAEIAGGVTLIIGLLTPVFAALNALNMLVAAAFVHAANGLWVADGGAELVLALMAGLAALVAFGAGRFSLDGLLARSSTPTDERAREPQAAGR